MLSLIRAKLRLHGRGEFDTDTAMKKPSLAFHWRVNQGGLQFSTKAGLLPKDHLGWAKFTKTLASVQGQPARR
jgi:hypothetical protein